MRIYQSARDLNWSLNAVFNGRHLTGWEGSPKYRDFFVKTLPDDLPLTTSEQAAISPDARRVAPQGRDTPRKSDAN